MQSSGEVSACRETARDSCHSGEQAKKVPRIAAPVDATCDDLIEAADSLAAQRTNRDDEIALLRVENAKLRAQLETQQGVPKVFGIRAALCGGCGVAQGVVERAYVRLGKLYCENCWDVWERCGWWQPALRINTTLPSIGASGLPVFGPEDAFCIPAFACAPNDLSLMTRLRAELPEGKEFALWNGARHLGLQFEGAEALHTQAFASRSLREVVAKLETAFGVKASAARLNLYRSDDDYKTLHQDRGQDSNGVPQVTVGLSLGATREIAFNHWQTGLTMTFPLANGSVFAFTPELNQVFLHGIPKLYSERQSTSGPSECTERLSLILWGSRVTDPNKLSPQ